MLEFFRLVGYLLWFGGFFPSTVHDLDLTWYYYLNSSDIIYYFPIFFNKPSKNPPPSLTDFLTNISTLDSRGNKIKYSQNYIGCIRISSNCTGQVCWMNSHFTVMQNHFYSLPHSITADHCTNTAKRKCSNCTCYLFCPNLSWEGWGM